jgi:hypothetical protein
MRNNVKNFSGSNLELTAAAHGGGLYFSEQQSTASGYANSSGQYDTNPLFVLEAAGGPGTWRKSDGISTSHFDQTRHQEQLRALGRNPFACVLIRGVFMNSSRAGSPSTSDTNRAYFERAQAAYDDIVGARLWDNSDIRLLDIVGPSKGLQASAVQPRSCKTETQAALPPL